MLSEEQTAQSVAIIGMAGRFPGADSVRTLWKNLLSGIDSLEEINDDDLRASGVPDEILNNPLCIKRAGVIHNTDFFDAAFFGYSPRESNLIDPQQRLLLECAWETFEDAGYTPESVNGSVGVFAGAGMNYYFLKNLLSQNKRFEDIVDSMTFMGNDKDYLCSRISYKLGLNGPCYVVNSACSTSLVAVQVGYSSLITGQCDLALCGGVALQSPRSRSYLYTDGDIFSKDGCCRTFDKDASGMVFGEGLALVLLKRLEDAIHDNDHIYSIIRSAVVNNDGSAKAGYTAPGINGQFELISLAQDIADISPDEIAFIEAHGTGTKLGDAIEISALTQAFRRKTDRKQFCAIGSIKTNIGHLDVAAGVTGLIKASLALKHKTLPPSLHCKLENPELNLEESPFYVAKEPVYWKSDKCPLIAGVSSFGMGGTNAHIILQEPFARKPSLNNRMFHLMILSARSEHVLDEAKNRFFEYISETNNLPVQDICYTLQVGRRAFKHRWFSVCNNTDDLLLSLSNGSGVITGKGISEKHASTVFAFSGQGLQYPQMGKDLYDNEPYIRSIMDEAREIIKEETGEDFFDTIFPSPEITNEAASNKLARTYYTQPALFIIEYAVAKLTMSYGIKPTAFIGHSIGEYVAAALSEVFTFEQGLRIVLRRAKIMDSANSGLMLYVNKSEKKLKPMVDGNLVISLVNGPDLCVVSGPEDEVLRFSKKLDNEKIRNGILKTSHAFHSPMMSNAAQTFKSEIEKFKLNKPSIKFISNVTGVWITDEQCISPDYWVNHIIKTVRFSDGVELLLKSGYRLFLEIGPGNSISTMINMHSGKYDGIKTIQTVKHHNSKVNDQAFFLGALGHLWTSGIHIDWNNFYSDHVPYRIPLPTYPFDRKRFWIDSKYNTAPSNVNDTSSDIKNEHTENEGTESIDKTVSDIWKNTLGVPDVKLTDDFFELGGNSLIASQLISRFKPITGDLVSITDLLKNTTLKSQIELVKNNMSKINKKVENIIPVISRDNKLPLSSAQERLWFIYKMDRDNISSNLVQGIYIKGKLNTTLFKRAWSTIVSRHETFRSLFIEDENGPFVRIVKDIDYSFIEEDFSLHSNSSNKARERIIENARKPFNLETGPLFRVGIYHLSSDEYYFILYIHHIISDGWSMSIWIQELTQYYSALINDENPPLDPLPLQFVDYSAWSISEERKFYGNQYNQFWTKNLGNNPPVLQLPTDHKRPAMPKYYGKIVSFSLSSEQYEKIDIISRTEKITKFNILLGMFFTLLYRYSNQDQIIIGCPNANRTINSEVEKIIGFFINMVPYKACFDENTTFKDLLEQIKRYYEECLPYQDIPFAKLVEIINPPRITNRTPVFQTMFAFQNYPYKTKTLKDLTIERDFFDRGASEYDLSLYLIEENSQISGIFEYSTELFEYSTILTLTNIFKVLIDSIIKNMNISLKNIPIVPQKLMNNFFVKKEVKPVVYNAMKTAVQLFEEQVIHSKTKIACIFGSESITYDQLNKKANRLGSYLRKMGVGTDDLVGIMVDRSIDMLAALLGILKAGGGYVPLDPSFPKERLSYMIEDSGLKVLISQSDALTGVNIPKTVSIITIDKDWQTIKNEPDINLSRINTADNTAYVIYTSGSTGNPKGVVISHKSLVNFLTSMKKEPGILPDDIFLAVTTVSFDISGLELFGPLICGARIILADSISASNGEKLLQLIKENKVTVMQATPATWKLLLDAGWNDTPTLRVFCGGEALTRTLADKMLSTNSQIWNLYGPTETTIWSSVSRVTEGDDEPDIGKPIDNTFFLIVDKMNNPLPDGFYGELCIGGDGLAKEYLHRKDLTRDRFVEIDQIGRVYKTGDLARKRHDGTYEYSGRIDFQVKVNGFRIELGEIENVLKKFSSIKDAIVNVYEDKEKNKSLVAYLIIDNYDKPTDIDTYRSFCQKKLPYYMVPQFFIVMEQFPLTANGKIDRKKLPAPHFNTAGNQHRFQKPQTDIEKKLVHIWGQLLSIDTISITDNYFELGGTSLLATKLFSKIEKVFGITLPLVTLFSAPTIKLLADSIKKTDISSNRWPLVVPIRLPKQASEKKPLFFVHGGGGNILLYRELANHLPDDIPVYGIQAQGIDGKQEVLTTIEDMASRYIEEITKIDPDGPYYLGGYCMGGTIVYEMARQLKQQNRDIGIVALFDTYREWFELSRPQKLVYLINNIQFHLKNIHQASLKGKYLFLKERSTEALRRIERKIKVVMSNAAFRLKLRKVPPLLIMENINDSASYRYKAKPYDGIITVFKSKAVSNIVDPYLGWKNVETGGIDLVNLSAYQNGILVSPFVEELAKKLSEKLQQSFDKHSDKTDYVLNGQNKP